MTDEARVERSVSTWQQPVPLGLSLERRAVLAVVADMVTQLGRRRVRVAIDGLTAAGKTTFGHELAAALAARGRAVLRASLDDFKRPWRDAHLYDRTSGAGYYRNAYDIEAIHRLLLEPARPDGSGAIALCSIDPITQIDHSHTVVDLPDDGVLIVDGVFALRAELCDDWDLTIWLSIDTEMSIQRGIDRDHAFEGGRQQAESLHRERYLAAELIYLDEVDPTSLADVVVDNTNLEAPVLLRS